MFSNFVCIWVAFAIAPFASAAALQAPLSAERTANTFLASSIFGKYTTIQSPQTDFCIDDTFSGYEPYAGIATFAHLNWTNCFNADADEVFDIGIVGAPFDLGVTYRPGERFGPAGTRMGSRRLTPAMGYR